MKRSCFVGLQSFIYGEPAFANVFLDIWVFPLIFRFRTTQRSRDQNFATAVLVFFFLEVIADCLAAYLTGAIISLPVREVRTTGSGPQSEGMKGRGRAL